MRRDLPAPDPPPERLTLGAFPPYRYVPGLHPHPFRHRNGHAWAGGEAPVTPAWTPCAWFEDGAWCRGIDLFNHRYYWEAHEVWEGMWRQVPVDAPLRDVLQGLIQAAAAVLKRQVDQEEASSTLLMVALARLRAARRAADDVVHGLRVDLAEDALLAWHDGGPWPLLSWEVS